MPQQTSAVRQQPALEASIVSSRVALELLMIQIKALRPQEGACSLVEATHPQPSLNAAALCGGC